MLMSLAPSTASQVLLRHESSQLFNIQIQVAKNCAPLGAKKVETYGLNLNDFEALDKLAKSLIEKHTTVDGLVR